MTQITKPSELAQRANAPNSRAARCAATSIGAAILGASALAIIHAGNLDAFHAAVVATMALGVLAGSALIGRAWSAQRHTLAMGLGIALLAGEAFNLLSTADRIVAEREATQATVRTATGAHAYAATEQAKAQAAFDAANRAAVGEAAKPGCKQHCRALIEGQVAQAKADLDVARQRAAANPKPTASGTPLADRLGVPAWTIDLAMAALLSIGANSLAAALVAFGAHGNPATGPERGTSMGLTVAGNPPPKPGKRNNRRGRKPNSDVVNFIAAYEFRNGRKPSALELQARFPQLSSSARYRYAAAA